MFKNDVVKAITTVKRGVTIKSKTVVANPDQLFNKVICATRGSGNLKQYFGFELSPFSPSLFEINMNMRKEVKSTILKEFKGDIVADESLPHSSYYVLDVGSLMQSVVWPKGCTYNEVLEVYTNYVLRNFGEKVSVVFDGYSDYPTTKQLEQQRRSKRTSAK